MKRILFILTLVIAAATVQAQDSSKLNRQKPERRQEKRERVNFMSKQEEEGVLSYRKQSLFGLQLRTNGYGAFYELGIRSTPRVTNTYSIELTEIKNPKEEKVQGVQNFFGGGTFVYGKLINFYQVKLGFGKQYIFGQKGNKNGVAVIGLLQGGLSMGLAKPYFLQVEDSVGNQKTISYYDDSTTFINPRNVFGTGGIGKGWNQVKVKPGLYLKGGLRFDFGKFNETVSAIEIGLSVDAYSDKIQILDYNPGKQLYFQGHIAFVFGRRK